MALPFTLSKLPLGLLLFFASNSYATLPYTPTRILAAPKPDGQVTYILEPPSLSSPKGRLSKLSETSELRSSHLSTTTISSSLPFLEQDLDAAFTAAISHNGSISVYSGDCSLGGQGSSLWQFTPSGSKGVWSQRSYKFGDAAESVSLSGPYWLASGISFSSDVADSDNFYIFGGMCPLPDAGTVGTWTSSATYSNQLLDFQSQAAMAKYDFLLSPGNGQPTPEAGFSITPLNPTHSKSPDGSITQQQDFILVGGHTETAFINMNMIALYSLPQSSWTFLPVEVPVTTDLLAKRDAQYVDSRSGHTAVLTPDGLRVIVFGGWVGDISKPAEPQLAILEVGAGYGGSKSWRWSNSDQSPFTSEEGIYGHGAVMLPGEIMLVTGGFSISGSSTSAQKRALQQRNTKNHFLNTTSGRWIQSYDMSTVQSQGKSNDISSALDSKDREAGLIAGLVFGSLALFCIGFFYICYRRRLKKAKQEQELEDETEKAREQEVDDLAVAATRSGDFQNLARTSIDGRGGSLHASSVWDGRRQPRPQPYPSPYGDNGSGMREAQRSGVDLNIPSPQRGLRHSIARRPVAYHSAPRYDESRHHWTSGDMHAIEERDEENSSSETSRQPSLAHTRPNVAMVNDSNDLDPFKDPEPEPDDALGHRTLRRSANRVSRPSPGNLSPAEERHREMAGWIRDWVAVDTVAQNDITSPKVAGRYSPTKSGRSSPSKSERTESNLSEQSTRSNLSARSGSAFVPASSMASSRNASFASSIRGYLPSILPAVITNPFAFSVASPAYDPSSNDGNAQTARERAGSNASALGTSSGSGGDVTTDRTDSFATARTTGSHSQPENDPLLEVNPDAEPTFIRRNANSSSPVRTGRPSLIGGWVGSVRRGVGKALTATVAGRSTSLTTETARTRGVIGSDGYYQYTPTSSPAKSDHGDKQGDRSGSLSPSKRKRQSAPGVDEKTANLYQEASEDEDQRAAVRRSVSDGGAFWTAKRGAHDWNADAEPMPRLFLAQNRSNSQHTLVPLLKSQRTQSSDATVGWRVDGAWRSEGSTILGSIANSNPFLDPIPSQLTRSASKGGQQNVTSDSASDWDVEAAVEQRVVQVMFTVPREKLRVVNADVEVASLVSTLREDEEWLEGNRELTSERIWAIAENNIMEEIGEAPEEEKAGATDKEDTKNEAHD